MKGAVVASRPGAAGGGIPSRDAAVIGLLSWFWLVAHVLLVAAELNVVLHRRLWPRTLAGDLEPADRIALRRSAEAARRDRRESIEVSFTGGGT